MSKHIARIVDIEAHEWQGQIMCTCGYSGKVYPHVFREQGWVADCSACGAVADLSGAMALGDEVLERASDDLYARALLDRNAHIRKLRAEGYGRSDTSRRCVVCGLGEWVGKPGVLAKYLGRPGTSPIPGSVLCRAGVCIECDAEQMREVLG